MWEGRNLQRPSFASLHQGMSISPPFWPHLLSIQGLPNNIRKLTYVFAADCVPCPPGHFSPGNNQACKPWTNCTLSGKQTRHPASDILDTVCEDRSPLATLLWKTQRPTFRPTTVQSTTVWPRTSQLPSIPTLVALEGPAFAVILGLGLGLLAPLTVLLALYLLRKARRLPNTPKPCWGNSFRTPIQEEQTDTHFTLAKI